MQNDHPRKPDELNRTSLAVRIKDVIERLNSDDRGFTISIEGHWGAGKSWLVEKIKTELNGSANIVEFNPWLIGNQSALLSEFFECLIDSFKTSTSTRVTDQIRKYAKRFAKLGLAKISEYAIENDLPEVVLAATVVQAAMPDKAAVESLTDLRIKLIDQLQLLPKKIVVVVDDIDRLAPTEVVEVIRLIKSIGELPNIVYVIAIDHEYVENALRVAGHGQHDNYLDKIIQLRIPIPPMRYAQKWKLLYENIKTIDDSDVTLKSPGGESACEHRLNQLAQPIAKLIENPRDVVRIWNRFTFVEPSCRSEINPIDLLALQVIHIKAPKLYEDICQQPRLYTNGEETGTKKFKLINHLKNQNNSMVNSQENLEIDHQNKLTHLESFLENRNLVFTTATIDLITELFSNFYSHHKIKTNRNLGHIDNIENLQFALNVGQLDEQWTLSEIDTLLFNKNSRDTVLEKCITYELQINLFHNLTDRTSEFSKIDDWMDLIIKVSPFAYRSGFMELSPTALLIHKWLKFNRDSSKNSTEIKIKTSHYCKQVFNQLMDFQDCYDAFYLLSIDLHNLKSNYEVNFEKADLNTVIDAFIKTILLRLDEGKLLDQRDAHNMIELIYQERPSEFKEFATNETRFQKWFEVINQNTLKRSYAGGRKVHFHRVWKAQIEALGGSEHLEKYLKVIETQIKNLSQSKLSLVKAIRKPDAMYDPVSGLELHDSNI
jgi:KAP family P-loop domain